MLEGYTGTSVIHKVPNGRARQIKGARYGTSLCGRGCSLDFATMPASWKHPPFGFRPCIQCAELTPAPRAWRVRWVTLAVLAVVVLWLWIGGR